MPFVIYPVLLLTGGALGVWFSKGLSTLTWLVIVLVSVFAAIKMGVLS